MLSGISGAAPYSAYAAYGPAYAGRAQGAEKAQAVQRPSTVLTARKAAQPDSPVQPVNPVRPVRFDEDPAQSALMRQASDPVEMAVRMRIQYPDGANAQGANAAQAAGAQGAQNPVSGVKGEDGADNAASALTESKSPQEVMEEAECQTCKERKYQDGSDDPGVSFKTPSHIGPEQAASAVRGHENEHVVREQAKAEQEDRRVVSQSVTLHTDICPECGKVYISGGTTRTVTKADNSQQADQRQDQQDSLTPAAVA